MFYAVCGKTADGEKARKEKTNMKKKILSLFAAVSVICRFIMPVSYAETEITAQILMDNPGEITVKANVGTKGEAVTVAVLNPGKDISDASTVSSGNYTDVFLYNNIVLTDTSGNLNVTAEGDFENNEIYTVYIKTADGREYTEDFSYYNDDERLTYISYGENSVMLEGIKTNPVHIVVLNPGYSVDDYKNNAQEAVLCDKIIEPNDGEYKAEISGIDFSKGDYTLYINGESYTLREPINFYVSKSGSNVNNGSLEKPFFSIAGARDY